MFFSGVLFEDIVMNTVRALSWNSAPTKNISVCGVVFTTVCGVVFTTVCNLPSVARLGYYWFYYEAQKVTITTTGNLAGDTGCVILIHQYPS